MRKRQPRIKRVSARARTAWRWSFRLALAVLAATLITVTVLLANSYRTYAKLVDDRLARGYQTSRTGIYAAPRTLRIGQKYFPQHLAEILRNAGYVENDSASEVWNGSFSQTAQGIEIRSNTADGP